MTARGTTVWERDRSVLWRRSGDTAVLKCPDRDDIVTLDGSGLAVWSELERPATVEEVAARLGARFDVPASTVAVDLTRLLADLERLHVVSSHAA